MHDTSTKELPSLEYLNECFAISSDSPSGLMWKQRPKEHFISQEACNARNGKTKKQPSAGYYATNGYYSVTLDNSNYQVHRIIYAIHNNTTDLKDKIVDHVNRNPKDNRPQNLRLLTRKENLINRAHNDLTIKWQEEIKKWYVYLIVDKKHQEVGFFDSLEEARNAYRESSIKTFKELSPFYNGVEEGYCKELIQYQKWTRSFSKKVDDNQEQSLLIQNLMKNLHLKVETSPLLFATPNINLNDIFQNHSFKDIKIPFVFSLFSFIHYLSKINKNLEFVNINYRFMEWISGSKHSILNGLISKMKTSGLIICDEQYKVGGYSMGYKLGEMFEDVTWNYIDFESFLISLNFRKMIYKDIRLKCWDRACVYFNSYKVLPQSDQDALFAATGFKPSDFHNI